jgi:hypothetical protein
MQEAVNHFQKYMKNPDVVIREEDQDGVLLFNPDTDQILVLNQTAFFIWRQCDGTQTMADILRVVKDSFEDVPQNEVENHVTSYVNNMLASGFIGTVEE